MVRMVIGAIAAVIGVVMEVSITFGAAHAAHLSFWNYAMLNNFGVFVLDMRYSPPLALLAVVLALGGGGLFTWAYMGKIDAEYGNRR